MKRLFFSVCLFLSLTSLCQAETPSKTVTKRYGGTLVWGHATKPTSLNPLLATSGISVSLTDLLFNGLVRLNPLTKEVDPDLAESWEISPDSREYTFRLRKNVKFHDGNECTAEDVVFTYEKVSALAESCPYSRAIKSLKQIKLIDRYSVRLDFLHPVPVSWDCFNLKIIPKHIFKDLSLADPGVNRHPVGTGPFVFGEKAEDDTIVIFANKDYFSGRPFLDCIKTKRFNSNHEAWAALMRQEIDMVLFIGLEDYRIVKDDPVFRAYALPAQCYFALQYNTEDPLLTDMRVREAIAYAVNCQEMIDKIEHGYGFISNGPIYPQAFGFNPAVSPYAYNPLKARELLRTAGWEYTNKNGILEKDGQELLLKVLVLQGSEAYRKIIMYIRQDLQAVGIKLIVIPYADDGELSADFVRNSGAQACLRSLIAGYDLQAVVENWIARPSERVGAIWKYTNKEVQLLIEALETSMDSRQNSQLLHEIHKQIYEDQPCCFLYYPSFFHVVSDKFKNTGDFFSICAPAYTIKDWICEAN